MSSKRLFNLNFTRSFGKISFFISRQNIYQPLKFTLMDPLFIGDILQDCFCQRVVRCVGYRFIEELFGA